MANKCVFCGNVPEDKGKPEHVIPEWLIDFLDMTRGTGRYGYTFNVQGIKERKFDAKSYKFPACSSCNERYSDFENAASQIIKKIFTDGVIDYSPESVTLLLDWFDKVRIGVWLGQKYLDKDTRDDDFFIDKKIRKSDRALFIGAIAVNAKQYCFGPIMSAVFRLFPAGFYFRIGHLCFINISNDFLVSKMLGVLPHASFKYTSGTQGIYGPFMTSESNLGLLSELEKVIDGQWLLQSVYPYVPELHRELEGYRHITEFHHNDKHSWSDPLIMQLRVLVDKQTFYSTPKGVFPGLPILPKRIANTAEVRYLDAQMINNIQKFMLDRFIAYETETRGNVNANIVDLERQLIRRNEQSISDTWPQYKD